MQGVLKEKEQKQLNITKMEVFLEKSSWELKVSEVVMSLTHSGYWFFFLNNA